MSLQIVRFNGRYYVEYAPEDDSDWRSDGGNVGQAMVNSIPPKAPRYRGWLKRMREKYAATERYFESYVFPISGAPPDPTPAERDEFLQLPSVLPQLNRLFTDHHYIINLDQEIFTVDFGAHFKLGNIPHEDNTWHYATVPSIYLGYTVATDLCDEDQLASPAVELPERVDNVGYPSHTVAARVNIENTLNRWLVRVLAEIVDEYATVIVQFGREWAPDALSRLKYRIDDDWRIVPATTTSQPHSQSPLFAFEAENTLTAKTARLREMNSNHRRGDHGLAECNWMPIVGAESRALMFHVLLEFFEDDDEEDENETDESASEAPI
ncbi:hypothetical protein NEMBOFW57_008178 [Staphylotrichum longicolle]|uniref:Uncharacterized protein n=1 Tax=Staphylotrichum longicolle TaxID=669026 RepID=A0AAD4EQZ9_9PEZI|nr:hypothetical protein NEMBOFW57_008178 [Staphylotrichum longicolle]